MLKKIVLSLLMTLVMASGAHANDDKVYYINEAAIGYKDAKAQEKFPASISEMINKLGKVSTFDTAISRSNKDIYLNTNVSEAMEETYTYDKNITTSRVIKIAYTSKKINLSEITPHRFLRIDNMFLFAENDINFVRMYTDIPFTTKTIYSDNYKVSYTIGNGYLYKIVIGTKYKKDSDKTSIKNQKEYLSIKTHDYLNYNEYRAFPTGSSNRNLYLKGDLLVEVDAADEVDLNSSEYFNISITNERLMQAYQRNKTAYDNANVNQSLKDFDRVMK